MRDTCRQAMARAIGRDPTAKELDDIENRLRKHLRGIAARDPVRNSSLTARQRLDEAAQSAAAEIAGEAVKKQQRTALNIIARARLAEWQDAHPKGELSALSDLFAFDARAAPGAMSIETRATAIWKDAARQLETLWEQGGDRYLGLFQSTEGLNDLIKEIHGEPTGNKDAKAAADDWHRIAEGMRQAVNDAGGDIAFLEDWGKPQHHSTDKVRNAAGSKDRDANREKWVTDTAPLMDRTRFIEANGERMTDARFLEFLRESWLSISTGGILKREPGQFKGGGMRANRNTQERQLHFKNADAFMQYQALYGEKGLFQVLIGHLQGMAKEQAALEVMGPDADRTAQWAIDRAVQSIARRDPTQTEKAKKRAEFVQRLYDGATGNSEPVVNKNLSKGADDLRSLMVASRLGSAVITSIGDEGTMLTTARANGFQYAPALRNELHLLNPANAASRALIRRAGFGLDTAIGALNRFGDNNLGHPMGRIAGAAMRASGLNVMTEARQQGFAAMMMDGIGDLTRRRSFSQLHEGDHAILAAKGVTEADWKIWKAADVEKWGVMGETVLTPDAIAAVPDAAIARAIGSKEAGAIRRARQDAALRLIGAVSEEVNMAIIEPGVRERVQLSFGTTKGTAGGELVRGVMLFKSFPWAMMTRHWGRASTLNGRSRAAYMATLIASTTVLGGIAVQVGEVISGRDPRNMNDWRFYAQSLLKGGSLGMFGDFLFSEASQHGSSPVAALGGPVISLLEEASNLTQGNMIQHLMSKDTNWEAEAVKFFKGITPGASTWYLKAAFDRLFWQRLQEHFNPGYLGRMKQRAQKEFGQQYWAEPGAHLPRRAPDLSRAWQ